MLKKGWCVDKMGCLELRSIGKALGGKPILEDMSFRVNHGEFYTILGPSGCGKTTTLRIIAGILEQDTGTVLLDGKDISGLPPYKRDITMVFQNYALFPHMSIFNNVGFGLKMQRMHRGEIRQKVREGLAQVNLSGYENKYPRQLSGGQQQRVALARSIIVMPAVLAFDEPLSNLDAKLRAQMRIELRRIHIESGITSIYGTHDQAEALSRSERSWIMNEGKIQQVATPREVYNNPQSGFVASFIGEANRLAGTVTDVTSSDSAIKVKVGNEILLCKLKDGFKEGDRVSVFVRPEDMLISPKVLATDNVFQGKVVHRSYTGSQVQYVFSRGDWLLTASTRGRGAAFNTGQDIYIGWDKEYSNLIRVE